MIRDFAQPSTEGVPVPMRSELITAAEQPNAARSVPGGATRVMALLAVICTWPLLLVGGTVTVYRVGMAVPDWPTTFGVNMFLYDLLNSPWGVFIEHTHRLYGALVGLLCVALAVSFTLAEGRRGRSTVALVGVAAGVLGFGLSQRIGPLFAAFMALGIVSLGASFWFALMKRQARPAWSWFVLAAVVGQGILGGLRVRQNSALLAFVHGSTAQAVFASVVALWVMTSGPWSQSIERTRDDQHVRRRSATTLALVAAQLVAGAYLRHFGSDGAVLIHAFLAAAVVVHVIILARTSITRDVAGGAVRGLLIATAAQVLVGVLSWWVLRPFDGSIRSVWPAQAAIRIAHQGLGALLLACAVVLAMRAFRFLERPMGRPAVAPSTSATTRGLEVAL